MASTPEMRAAVVGAWVRPLLAAACLAGISVWLTCDPSRSRRATLTASMPVMPHLELTPPADLFGLAGPLLGWTIDAPGAVLHPPLLRDAQEWPRGMVIKPPSTNDRIAVSGAGPLDILLSALLAPWLATAS